MLPSSPPHPACANHWSEINIVGVLTEMEGAFQHIHHEGFTEYRKLSARQKWVAFGIFAVAAFFYTFAPFTLSVPILTFMLRWYPRPVILYINWAVGKWLTITIVSAYCLLLIFLYLFSMSSVSRDPPCSG